MTLGRAHYFIPKEHKGMKKREGEESVLRRYTWRHPLSRSHSLILSFSLSLPISHTHSLCFSVSIPLKFFVTTLVGRRRCDCGGLLEPCGCHGHGRGVVVNDLPSARGLVALVHEDVAGLGRDLLAVGRVEVHGVVAVVQGDVPIHADEGLVVRHGQIGQARKHVEVVADLLRVHA